MAQGEGGPVAGGGTSEDGSFSYGFASFRGKRAAMEDFHHASTTQIGGKQCGFFGVFDGHGGARAAEYVQDHIFQNLAAHPKFESDTAVAIAESYNQTDQDYLKLENAQNKDAGSTASTAVIVGNKLLIANVGDSRAVISRGGQAIALFRPHNDSSRVFDALPLI